VILREAMGDLGAGCGGDIPVLGDAKYANLDGKNRRRIAASYGNI
jgi:hypothetical protein